MKKPNFEGYVCLKNDYSHTSRGIQLNQVLSLQLLQLSFKLITPDKATRKTAARLLNKTLNVSPFVNAFEKSKVVSSYINQRKDYQELADSYFAKCKEHTAVHLPSLVYKRKVSYVNIIKAFSFVFLKKHSGSANEKFYLACYLVYYLNLLDTLTEAFKNTDLRGKKYAPFNSSFDLETLFTLFFKHKGADTYHTSHGLSYVNFKGDTNIDGVNGENITAANLLVWGETSRTDLINNYNHDPGAITVAGNPKYPAKLMSVKQTFKKGIVFLGGPVYDKDNAELITLTGRIATRNNIEFSVKAHPFSNLKHFSSIALASDVALLPNDKTITETLRSGDYDFAIAYNTTSYYEAMYYNMVCFRYAVNESGDYKGLDDKFYDQESFDKQLDRYKNIKSSVLNESVQQVLVDNLGMGINKYEYIFNN